ncbi:MAG: hypothetical protein ACI82A_004184 [Candidatus Azotimanducaceae bacterium]|jgi:hypothetical protein
MYDPDGVGVFQVSSYFKEDGDATFSDPPSPHRSDANFPQYQPDIAYISTYSLIYCLT